jgi:hypothetical protein
MKYVIIFTFDTHAVTREFRTMTECVEYLRHINLKEPRLYSYRICEVCSVYINPDYRE